MFDYDLIVINGIVITDTEAVENDIAIKGEKIDKIAPRGTFSGVTAERTIDAKGGYIMVRHVLKSRLYTNILRSQEVSMLTFILPYVDHLRYKSSRRNSVFRSQHYLEKVIVQMITKLVGRYKLSHIY